MVDISSLFSTNWRERKRAIEFLAQAPQVSLVQQLLDILRENHQNLDVLNSTLQLLQNINVPVVPGLVELLHHSDPETRTYAALVLGHIKDPAVYSQAVPAMLKVLEESCGTEGMVNLCFNIIESLGLLRAHEAADRFHVILEMDNYFLSFAAVQALGEIADIRSLPYLLDLLNDDLLAAPAVSALGRLNNVSAIEPIAAWLESSRGEAAVSVCALVNLASTSSKAEEQRVFDQDRIKRVSMAVGPSGLARLLEMVPDPYDAELLETQTALLPDLALLLGWILIHGEADEPHLLINALLNLLSYPAAYHSASNALIETGNVSVSDLAEVLSPVAGQTAAPLEIRLAAASLLGTIKTIDSRLVLENTLSAEEFELVVIAASALGQIGDPQAVEALLSNINHSSAAVRKAVVNAVKSLKLPQHNKQLLDLLENSSTEVRVAVLEILANRDSTELVTDDLVPSILAMLADPSLSVRRAAIEALPYYKDPQIPSALAELIVDQDPILRSASARALSLLAADFALPLLHQALNDSDPWVRMYACRSLAQHGQIASLSYITPLRDDPMPPVRLALIEYLACLPAQTALSELQSLLTDSMPEVHRAAERAMTTIKRKITDKKSETRN
jgi:HEAT repeat protein